MSNISKRGDPLQSLVAQAARTLPRDTGTVAVHAERQRRLGRGHTTILADVSGSMDAPAWGGRSRYDVLRTALEAQTGYQALLAFASDVHTCTPATLPRPSGTTSLHTALDRAIAADADRILVVTDGEPDSEDRALAAVTGYTGVVDVIYVGPDGNRAAMLFLQALARAGHGQYRHHDLTTTAPAAIAATMRTLLAPPK